MSYETIRGILTILEDLGQTEAMGAVRAAVDKLEEKDAEIARLLCSMNEAFIALPQSSLAWDGSNIAAHVRHHVKRLRRERDEAREQAAVAERALSVDIGAWKGSVHEQNVALRARVKALEEGLERGTRLHEVASEELDASGFRLTSGMHAAEAAKARALIAGEGGDDEGV